MRGVPSSRVCVVSAARDPHPSLAQRQRLAYRAGVFAAACRTWHLRHRFTRPYRPQTNGKAERFIQTLLREWAYRFPYRSSARRTEAPARSCAFTTTSVPT